MGWMRTVVREIWGLFVDDGWFALAILVWVAVVWAAARFGHVDGWAAAGLLGGGLGLLLAESTWRFARGRRRG